MTKAGKAANNEKRSANGAAFDGVESWVFDLDNTLYSPRCALFTQIDKRMGEFISRLFDIDGAAARRLQKQYYRDYGTTLRGLMSEHRVDPHAFLDYVHDIDLSSVGHDAALVAALAALPGRKFIHTNATTAHAERVAGRIGLLEHVDHIFDIEAADYVPKPARETYVAFLGHYRIEPRRSAIFEDLERNLEAPAALGMTTVLVKPDGHPHPDAEFSWAVGRDSESHIHHVTYDLAGFLGAMAPAAKTGPAED